MSDDQVSTYAQRKIVAQDGEVVLKGPVRLQEERNAIEAKAAEVAGTGNEIDPCVVKVLSANHKEK
jgi:hyperosmotically inducible protein